jgi:uncharacterized membrane protein
MIMSFSTIRLFAITAGCMLTSLKCAAQEPAQGKQASFITFQVPGCALAFPRSINNSLSVAGNCSNHPGDSHGFVRDSRGDITTFDPPNSSYTLAPSINAVGAITGMWQEPNYGRAHGFVRSPQGAIVSFDPPGSTQTIAYSINAAGAITGTWQDANNIAHGFLRSPQGIFTSFDPSGSTQTIAYSINAAGAITGTWQDANNIVHGFLRSPQGILTSFDPAGSTYSLPQSINAAGAIVGTWGDANIISQAFLRSPGGTFSSLDFPGSTFSEAHSINAAGAITGDWYQKENNLWLGFVRSPQGAVTSFEGAAPQSINDLGVTTGWYGSLGFIHLPHVGRNDQEFQPGTYTVTDSHNLVVDGGFYLYGDPTVRLWVYVAGNPNQHWTFTQVSGGFTMYNKGTGLYASDIGGQLVESPVGDVWTVAAVAGGYSLKNNRTGLFLTDPAIQNGALTLTKKGSAWQMSPLCGCPLG